MASVTVLITVFDEPRLERAVKAVLQGDRVPDVVLLADGGSQDGTWERCQTLARDHGVVQAVQHLGSVAETRAGTMDDVTTDLLVFLDADEVSPPHWLGALVAPIESGEADVAGGPTKPLDKEHSEAERYVNAFDDWFYSQVVSADAASLPMGNSAWRTSLLRDIGGFDPRLVWGGEDYDVNLRARAAGARFQYVPDAWLYHDQAHLDSLGKLWRRMVRYSKGATVAYLKNGQLRERSAPAARSSGRFRHRYQPVMVAAKVVGFVKGWWAWRQLQA